MIVPGSTSQALAARLARALDEPLAPVSYDRFPDGELRRGIGDVSPDRAVVVCATTSSDAHVELLQLQDAAREAGADEVVTVLPYMGYARQDEAFVPGDPVSARAVARAISTGTDRVLTVCPHERGVCEHFDPPAETVSAAGLLAEPLPDDLVEPLFLAPDGGAVDLATAARDAYGRGEVDHFAKTRHSGSEVEITPSDASVAGRDVVAVDDIVATGSTMSEAVAVLAERGAERTYVSCVHPLLVDDAATRLHRAGVAGVWGTDTVERPVSEVSAAPAIAEHL